MTDRPAPPLRAMSYNVRYADIDGGEHGWENRRDPIATGIRFHRPHVVGLQEALHDQLEDLRERLPAFDWLVAGRPEGGTAGEYVPIGYRRERLAPEDDGSFWLSETPGESGSVGWDAALPRLVRHARFRDRRTGGEFLHVNTHFDHRGERARVESARLLRDCIDKLSGSVPVVVSGDFNCRESSEPYRVLTDGAGATHRRSLTDTHHISRYPHHGPETSMTDFNDLVPEKKIDHVFVSAGVDVINHGTCSDTYGDGCYPSDHLPVIADVSLPDPA
ncbi:endonuclease/exonuclease/phosphatase family protein [Halorarum halobium]|uniref:endonuclease/exonuclease/phosphatase family protein n=1 Tax=Halorarum halobium TaxID=3075121 RepID=UPI0028ADFCBD|nr:endonuclease/exonuclease/phosphatase family protein [Halobaculum sp. XH14]